VAGIEPRIEVLAIPDAKAFAGLASAMVRPLASPVAPVVPELTKMEQIETARSHVRAAVTGLWPANTAGEPLAIELDVLGASPRVHVAHFGVPLGAAGLEAMSRSVSTLLEREVVVQEVAIPAEAITRSDGDLLFVSRLAAALRASAAAGDVISICVVEPQRATKPARGDVDERELETTVHGLLAQSKRVTVEQGEAWSVRFTAGDCPVAPSVESR
jgi:hypothetical protein